MVAQNLLDATPLHALALAMNEADFTEAALRSSLQVALNDRSDVTGRESMQVDGVLNRNFDRFGLAAFLIFSHGF